MPLILASGSPRRHELLKRCAPEFTVIVPEVDETPLPGEAPRALVERLALRKACAVANDHPEALVLGSDTIVVCNGRIYGKPHDAAEAQEMLESLAGQCHEVMTSVALVCISRSVEQVASDVAYITMHDNSPERIAAYIATGEPMDKAGAYAVQGKGRELIAKVEGEETTVIGLPVPLVGEMMRGLELGLGLELDFELELETEGEREFESEVESEFEHEH